MNSVMNLRCHVVLSLTVAICFAQISVFAAHPNIVFITADDLNHDSLGCYGCPIADLTPNLDRLASEGLRIERAYSTVAVCQPVRQTMLTGLYPHRSGSMGFFPIKPEVRTLNQQMRDSGYMMAMLGKSAHYQPREQFVLDIVDDGFCRDPAKLAEATRTFITTAREQGKPFLHFVNCTDPHRNFITGPNYLAHGAPPSRYVHVDEVKGVPGFLEDLPDIRKELAQYYTSVRRLDDCVGEVLRVLDELGVRENTLVMFYGGDHGMPFPFAKTNDYEDSSRGALLLESRMSKVIFYHAGCSVCIGAEHTVADAMKSPVEKVHLGEQKSRVAEAEKYGVKSVPALVINGQAFHINFGADISVLK